MTKSTVNLKSMIRPESIAIVGASADFRKVSGRPLKHLIEKGYTGKLYPVNPRCDTIAGLTCYPSIDDLPEAVDLAVIVLPAHAVVAAVQSLGLKLVPTAIVFASGFGETGQFGRELELELAAVAKQAGVRLLGPNCLGLFNSFERVIATFSQYVDGPVPPGPIGFVSQSGAFGTAIAALARSRGLGLGYFINTGNEADVTFVDAMEEVLKDHRIRVGAGYIEGLKDGEGLCRLADQALELGKPLVVTKVGRHGAGARAAASHTGSLAGEDNVFDGVVGQKGIIRARNEEHMLDMVEVFAACSLPAGHGIGIATQSGGAGALIADRAEEVGLQVPELEQYTQEAIKEYIPDFGATGNPVDVTGQFVAEPAVLRESVIHMLADPNVHVGIIWLQLMNDHVDILLKIFDDIQARTKKPFVVAWVAAPDVAIKELRKRGVAVLRGAEPAVDAVAGLIAFAEARRLWLADQTARSAMSATQLPTLSKSGGPISTVDATALLETFGVPMASVRLAHDEEGAAFAAEQFGYPVVMKIESPNILHKTEVDGVRLNLKTSEEVRTAFINIIDQAQKKRPDALIHGVTVQPMCQGDVEFVIGLKNDPVFGAVIMAGLGGTLVEVLKDVSFRKCPLTPSEAERMLDSLKGVAMLSDMRGRAAVNREALVHVLCSVSRFGQATQGRLRELDLNPVLLTSSGAIAVDVVMILEEEIMA